MNVETVIFLGAGASKSEGAPLQGQLFKQYFGSPVFRPSSDHMDRELATFFEFMFGIDVDAGPIGKIIFPTFEEVLGLTDLAILRKEAFRAFDIENRATNSGRLRYIAQSLVFLVAKLLDAKLANRPTVHRQLVDKLNVAGLLKETAFFSTNYDILIDNALTEAYRYGVDLDYGVHFRNFDRSNDWSEPDRRKRVFLFKPHGSLNWLFCPACNALEITPKEKGVVTRLITNFEHATCPTCESVYMPLIVPPTFYKDLNNVFLATIWNRAESVLQKAKRVIFCGYSLPDADMHIKYLLKRAQTNRSAHLEMIVVNNHHDKTRAERKVEEYRFKRFLGRSVRYTDLSFEQFASEPTVQFNDGVKSTSPIATRRRAT